MELSKNKYSTKRLSKTWLLNLCRRFLSLAYNVGYMKSSQPQILNNARNFQGLLFIYRVISSCGLLRTNVDNSFKNKYFERIDSIFVGQYFEDSLLVNQISLPLKLKKNSYVFSCITYSKLKLSATIFIQGSKANLKVVVNESGKISLE